MHVTKEKALELKDSTEKPFANTEGASDATKALELKTMIIFTERLPTVDTATGETYERIIKTGEGEDEWGAVKLADD